MSGLLPLDVPIQIGAEEARRRALAELAKAKYGGESERWTWLTQQLSDLIERLVDWLTGVLPTPSSGGGPNWGFLAVVLVVLVLIGVVVWRVGLPRSRRRVRDAEVAVDVARTALDYRDSAEAAAAAGDWRTAVRERYRAIVRDLETATIIDPRPGRTAFEVAAAAGRLMPAASQDLLQAAGSFGAVSYGDTEAGPADYEEMVAVEGRTRTAIDQVDLAAVEVAPTGTVR